jgi:hypothetical protein
MWHKKFPPCYKTEREHTTEYFCFFYCLLDRGHFMDGGFFQKVTVSGAAVKEEKVAVAFRK